MTGGRSIRKIETWLSRRGFGLVLEAGLDWRANFAEMRVEGDPRFLVPGREMFCNHRDAIVVTLHECGHVERYRKGTFRHVPFPRNGQPPNDEWYLTALHEEFEAWEEAARIATRLRIGGLGTAFVRMRSNCLMSHVLNVARRGSVDAWMRAYDEKASGRNDHEEGTRLE